MSRSILQFLQIRGLLTRAISAAKLHDKGLYASLMKEANGIIEQTGQLPISLYLMLSEAQSYNQLLPIEEAILVVVHALLMCQEPTKALEVLKARPCGLDDSPALESMQRRIEKGLKHLTDWATYVERYTGPSHYQTTGSDTLNIPRRQVAMERLKNVPQNGHILSIGPNDALLERHMLETRPDVNITFVELSDFSEVFKLLEQDFPGKVRWHKPEGFNDYGPESPATNQSDPWAIGYDLIMMFEVLEHVNDPSLALECLYDRMGNNSTLLLSVPVGYKYIEEEHSRANWYAHVRAYNAQRLYKELDAVFSGMEIRVFEAPDRSYIAEVRLKPTPALPETEETTPPPE